MDGRIAKRPLSEQATYADVVTRFHVDEGRAKPILNEVRKLLKLPKKVLAKGHFPRYNATSVGNLAYVAESLGTESTSVAHKLLKEYETWYDEQPKIFGIVCRCFY